MSEQFIIFDETKTNQGIPFGWCGRHGWSVFAGLSHRYENEDKAKTAMRKNAQLSRPGISCLSVTEFEKRYNKKLTDNGF